MQNRQKKFLSRVLALALSLIMVIGVMPITISADEGYIPEALETVEYYMPSAYPPAEMEYEYDEEAYSQEAEELLYCTYPVAIAAVEPFYMPNTYAAFVFDPTMTVINAPADHPLNVGDSILYNEHEVVAGAINLAGAPNGTGIAFVGWNQNHGGLFQMVDLPEADTGYGIRLRPDPDGLHTDLGEADASVSTAQMRITGLGSAALDLPAYGYTITTRARVVVPADAVRPNGPLLDIRLSGTNPLPAEDAPFSRLSARLSGNFNAEERQPWPPPLGNPDNQAFTIPRSIRPVSTMEVTTTWVSASFDILPNNRANLVMQSEAWVGVQTLPADVIPNFPNWGADSGVSRNASIDPDTGTITLTNLNRPTNVTQLDIFVSNWRMWPWGTPVTAVVGDLGHVDIQHVIIYETPDRGTGTAYPPADIIEIETLNTRAIVNDYVDFFANGLTGALTRMNQLLPSTVMVNTIYGAREVDVEWQNVAATLGNFTTLGTVNLVGILDPTSMSAVNLSNPQNLTAIQPVLIREPANLVQNADFTDTSAAGLSHWTLGTPGGTRTFVPGPPPALRVADPNRPWQFARQDVRDQVLANGQGDYFMSFLARGDVGNMGNTNGDIPISMQLDHFTNGGNTNAPAGTFQDRRHAMIPTVNVDRTNFTQVYGVQEIWWTLLGDAQISIQPGYEVVNNGGNPGEVFYIADVQLIAINVVLPANNIASFNNPTRISVEEGTPFDQLPLPTAIPVVLEDGSSVVINVIWDEGDFDPNELGIYTFYGTFVTTAEIYNNRFLYPTIEVEVRAYGTSPGGIRHFSTFGDNVTGDGSIANPLFFPTQAMITNAGPGDQFLFNRGDVWHDRTMSWNFTNVNGSSDWPIIVGAYGDGPDPILAKLQLVNGPWSLLAGTTDVWYTPWTPTFQQTFFVYIDDQIVSPAFYRVATRPQVAGVANSTRYNMRNFYGRLFYSERDQRNPTPSDPRGYTPDVPFFNHNDPALMANFLENYFIETYFVSGGNLYIRGFGDPSSRLVEINHTGGPNNSMMNFQNSSYITIRDIHFKGSNGTNLTISGNTPTRNLEFHNLLWQHIGGYQNMFTTNTPYDHYGHVWANNIFDRTWGPTVLIAVGNNGWGSRITTDSIVYRGAGANVHIVGNTFLNWGHTTVNFSRERYTRPIIGGVDVGPFMENNIIEHNRFLIGYSEYNRAFEIQGDYRARYNIFRYNYVLGHSIRIQFFGLNNVMYGNIFDSMHPARESGVGPDHLGIVPWHDDFTATGNIVMNNTFFNGRQMIGIDNNFVEHNLFANNIFHTWWGNIPCGHGAAVNTAAGGGRTHLRNNAFFNDRDDTAIPVRLGPTNLSIDQVNEQINMSGNFIADADFVNVASYLEAWGLTALPRGHIINHILLPGWDHTNFNPARDFTPQAPEVFYAGLSVYDICEELFPAVRLIRDNFVDKFGTPFMAEAPTLGAISVRQMISGVEIVSVADVDHLTVLVGTTMDELHALGLPRAIEVTLADGSITTLPVDWAGYDPYTTGAQTLTGNLVIGDLLNTANITATAVVTVRNELEIVQITPVNNLTVNNGTAIAGILGRLTVTTLALLEDGTWITLTITWEAPGGFDSSIADSYVFIGTFAPMDGVATTDRYIEAIVTVRPVVGIGDEILENWNFDEDPTADPDRHAATLTGGWFMWGAAQGSREWAIGYGRDYSNALLMNLGGARWVSPAQKITDQIRELGQGTYYFEMWVRIPDGQPAQTINSMISVHAFYPNPSDNRTASTEFVTIEPGGDWEKVSGYINLTWRGELVGNGVEIAPINRLAASAMTPAGTILIDSISLRFVELLENPGFEDAAVDLTTQVGRDSFDPTAFAPWFEGGDSAATLALEHAIFADWAGITGATTVENNVNHVIGIAQTDITDPFYHGVVAIRSGNRTTAYDGPAQNVTATVQPFGPGEYSLVAYVKTATGTGEVQLGLRVTTSGTSTEFLTTATAIDSTFSRHEGTVILPASIVNADEIVFFVKTPGDNIPDVVFFDDLSLFFLQYVGDCPIDCDCPDCAYLAWREEIERARIAYEEYRAWVEEVERARIAHEAYLAWREEIRLAQEAYEAYLAWLEEIRIAQEAYQAWREWLCATGQCGGCHLCD